MSAFLVLIKQARAIPTSGDQMQLTSTILTKAVAGGGGSLGSAPDKERSIKRSTRMYKKDPLEVHYYSLLHADIDLDTVEDLNKFAIQSARACIFYNQQRKLHTKNQPTRRIAWLRPC